MSRIAERFAALAGAGRTGLIPFVTAGDPSPAATVPLLHDMVDAGADLLEIGVPFSDPMADGPVIQRANERSLTHGTRLLDVLDMVRRFRARDAETPVVLMGYLNPVESMGYVAFAERAAEAGVDGVLTVDMPPEEGQALASALRAVGVDPIFLLAPTSDAARIALVSEVASGYLYYVSMKGVTGTAQIAVGELGQQLAAIRAQTALPIGVGFGIRDAASAAAVAAIADAVIVGSALIQQVETHLDRPERIASAICELLAGMRIAIDAVTPATTGDDTR